MRIVMNQYADGDKFAVETATDGSVTMHDLLGQRKVGARISAYAEVACDDRKRPPTPGRIAEILAGRGS